MPRQDEGPLDTVGWGPFTLPTERKRLSAAEAARMAEVAATRQSEAPPARPHVPTDTLSLLVSRAATLLEQDPLPLTNRAELHGIAEALKQWDIAVKGGQGAPSRPPEGWNDHLMSVYRSVADVYYKAQQRKAQDDLTQPKAAAGRRIAEANEAARDRQGQALGEPSEQDEPTVRNTA
jgi:hypothetical protein